MIGMNHRAKPSDMLTPGLIGGALWRLMRTGAVPRRQVLAEVGRLGGQDRRRRNKQPSYVAADAIVERYPEADLATISDTPG